MDWNPGLQVWQLEDAMGEILSHYKSAKGLGRLSLVTKQSLTTIWRLSPHIDFAGIDVVLLTTRSGGRLSVCREKESIPEKIIPLLNDRLRGVTATSWTIKPTSWDHLRLNCINLTELSIESSNLFMLHASVPVPEIAAVLSRLRILKIGMIIEHAEWRKLPNMEVDDDYKSIDALLEDISQHIPASNSLVELQLSASGDDLNLNRATLHHAYADNSKKLRSFVNAFKQLKIVRFSPSFLTLRDFQDLEHLELVQILRAGVALEHTSVILDAVKSYIAFKSRSTLNFNIYFDDAPAIVHLLVSTPAEQIRADIPPLITKAAPLREAIEFCFQVNRYACLAQFLRRMTSLLHSGWFSPVDFDALFSSTIDCFALLKRYLEFAASPNPENVASIVSLFAGYLPTSEDTSCSPVDGDPIPAKETNLLWTLLKKQKVDSQVIEMLLSARVLGHVDSLRERADINGACSSLAHLCTNHSSVCLLYQAVGSKAFRIFHTMIRDGAGELPLEHLLREKHHGAAASIMGWLQPMPLGPILLTDEGFKSFFISLGDSRRPNTWLNYFLTNFDLRKYQPSSILCAMKELCGAYLSTESTLKLGSLLGHFVKEVRRLGIPIESASSCSGWMPLALAVCHIYPGNTAYLYSEFASQIIAEAAVSDVGISSDVILACLSVAKTELELRKDGLQQEADRVLEVFKAVFRCLLSKRSDSGACQVALMIQFISGKWSKYNRMTSSLFGKAEPQGPPEESDTVVEFIDFALQMEINQCQDPRKASNKRIHLLKTLRRLLERPSAVSRFLLCCLVCCLNHVTVEDLKAPSPTDQMGNIIAELLRASYADFPTAQMAVKRLAELGFNAPNGS